jgi:hypothetical protein
MADDKPRDDQMIAALKRERATYVARGDDDRVGQVDEQLKNFGYEGEQDAVVDPTGAPKGRATRASRQRTTDATSGAQADAKPEAKGGAAGKVTKG